MPRKSVVRLPDHHPNMTIAVYSGRKTTTSQQQPLRLCHFICGTASYAKLWLHWSVTHYQGPVVQN